MRDDIIRFLVEDIGDGDVTASVFIPGGEGTASIVCESEATVAGLEEARDVFSALGVDSQLISRDGDRVTAGTVVMSVHGPLKGIVTCERTALNMLMRMSGIATETAKLTSLVRAADPETLVAGTRKTTPGFRFYEKKAIALGGGWPHRSGLYDMVMIKDNHIAACGGMDAVLEKMCDVPPGIKVDIEVSCIEDGVKAAEHGADIIMADHMTPDDTRKLRELVRGISPKTVIEASGNITADNISSYAGCADIISVGSITHSAKAVHFSLDMDKP